MRRFVGLAATLLLSLNLLAGDKKKKDPEEIGNRDVGKGINFYSLEKEIGLGKSLAQDVERQAKIIDDPIIAEYVSRVGQNLVRNSDAKVPLTDAESSGVGSCSRKRCWFSVKSENRHSGRIFSFCNWFRQVFTVMRQTQRSIGTRPEYWCRRAKIFMKTVWTRSSSAVRRGR